MLKHKLSFESIGTQWSIETNDELTVRTQVSIERLIASFDKVYSRFRDDSLVHEISVKGEEIYSFPESAKTIFAFYEKLYGATSGKVTPLIGGSLESLGYDSSYSLRSSGSNAAPRWEDTLSISGTDLSVTQKVTLDIGAAGKGYLVDEVAKLIKKSRISSFTIDASGDIYTYSSPQRIGLENPFDSTKVIGVATIDNKALCASASNRRQWGDGLHHILDPETGEPVNDVLATWVVADTTMQADGIATALFFTSPDDLKSVCDFSYAVLRKDGSIDYSKDSIWEIF